MKLKIASPRVWELDYIRGILILLVTIDHVAGFANTLLIPTTGFGRFLNDVFYNYLVCDGREFLQPLVVQAFIFLSGMNRALTKNGMKSAVRFSLFALAFMIGYNVLGSLNFLARGGIIFNVIPVLSLCLFLWSGIEKLKLPKTVVFAFGVAAVIVGMYFLMPWMLYGCAEEVLFDFRSKTNLPGFFFTSAQGRRLSPMDYVALFPAVGTFCLGALTGGKLYKEKRSRIKYPQPPRSRGIVAVGRHSLIMYLLAPVAVMYVLALLDAIGLY